MTDDIQKKLILQARKDKLMKKLSKDMRKNYEVIIEENELVIKPKKEKENENI